MDGNRTSAGARNPGGKSEEGRTAGAASNGQPRSEQRSIQDLYGQAVDAAEDSIDAVRQMPGCLDDTVRRYIETRPYTTALIALGVGWLIGRSHRPF
jgi:ElaB/YqjD/DUF883 family membrane-anchored ribosome-binding protein